MRMSELFEDDDKLGSFKRSLGNAVRGGVSQIHADTALQQAKNPDQWRFKKGDQVYSKTTGKIYTITNLYYDSKRTRAMYFYSADNGEEHGSLIADLANKSLIKLNDNKMEEVEGSQNASETFYKNPDGSIRVVDHKKATGAEKSKINLPRVNQRVNTEAAESIGGGVVDYKGRRQQQSLKLVKDKLPDYNTSEAWSEKYKRSINCSNPRGFSQRAHCNGKKKNNEDATAGATSSASIATVVNPGMTNKGKATAAGKPGKMASKGPKQMSPKKQSPSDNALDSNAGLTTGTPIKR